MNCLQTIEHMHEKRYKNVYIWNDGMGSQFRFCYIFKLLAKKSLIDGIGGKVKNVILRKVKSCHLVVYSLLEFSEAVKKFFRSIHSVYLPGNENVVEPEDITMARKTDQTLKVNKVKRKRSQNGDTCIIFFKTANDDDLFYVQSYWG